MRSQRILFELREEEVLISAHTLFTYTPVYYIFNCMTMKTPHFLLYMLLVPVFFATLSWGTVLIPFREGDKWGYADENMEVKIPVVFDKVFPFIDDCAVFWKGNQYGVIDKNGDIIYSDMLDESKTDVSDINKPLIEIKNVNGKLLEISALDIRLLNNPQAAFDIQSNSLFKVGYYAANSGKSRLELKYQNPFMEWTKNIENRYVVKSIQGKFGFIDETGTEIIPAIYDTAGSFNSGFSNVCLKNRHGFINEKGEVALPLEYDLSKGFIYGLAVVKKNDTWKIIDTKKEVICELNGLDDVEIFSDLFILVASGDIKYLINHKRKKVLRRDYQFISQEKGKFISCFSNSYGEDLYDCNGKFITYSKNSAVDNIPDGDMFVSRSFKHGSGVMNMKGVTIIPVVYHDIKDAQNHIFIVQKDVAGKTGNEIQSAYKYALFSHQGKQITEFRYEYLKSEDSGRFFIGQYKSKEGMINDKGNIVCDFKYDDIHKEDYIKAIYNKSNCDIYSPEGKLVFSYNDDEPGSIYSGKYGVVVVASKGKKGAIDYYTGKYVIELVYDDVHIMDSTHAVIDSSGKRSFINFKDRSVKGDWYDYIHLAVTNFDKYKYIPVKNGGKYGFIDTDGKNVIECKYNEAGLFINSITNVTRDGIDFYIDEKGREYYK